MASDYTAEVLRYIRQKDSTGFNGPITWLGSEQRFVGALRNSGVNNLEEQYILGTDTYTIQYKDEYDNDIIEKHYCVTTSSTEDISGITDYYKLITTIYKNPDPNEDYKFDEESLVFSEAVRDKVLFGDGSESYPDLEATYFLDSAVFSYDGTSTVISPSTFTPVQKDNLYFVRHDGTDLLVLTKITGTRYTVDGKKVIQERIINSINN